MTDPKNPTLTEATTPLPLPGLDEPAGPGLGLLEVAARRTLAGLEADGLLLERHALLAEGILSLARVMTVAEKKGAATAAAHAFNGILAAFAVLVPEGEGGVTDDYDLLANELRDAARRGVAEVRDSS